MLRPSIAAHVVLALSLGTTQHAAAQAAPAAPAERPLEALLQGPAFEAEVKSQQQRNTMAVASANAAAALQRPDIASVLARVGNELRYGRHNVVSSDGETVVGKIRSLTNAQAPQRAGTLAELRTLANGSNPEALNFFGFAAEYGLFGEPRDLRRATQLYRLAAASGYQPALYNLALVSAYGKLDAPNLPQASAWFERAAAAGPDSSARVCGMAAFVAYRRANTEEALRYGRDCNSPLATLAIEALSPGPMTLARVERLRATIGTGVDDGLVLIAGRSRDNAAADNQVTYCKYHLVEAFRRTHRSDALLADARRCYDATAGGARSGPNPIRADQAARAIAAFVPAEAAAIDTARRSNHFHYSWSVPYLPFGASETALFEPVVQGSTAPLTARR